MNCAKTYAEWKCFVLLRDRTWDFMSTQILYFPHETSQLIWNSWEDPPVFVFFLLNLMASYIIPLLYLVFRICILLFPDPIGSIIVCVEAQQKSASPLFCPLMMTAAYCRPTTRRYFDISILFSIFLYFVFWWWRPPIVGQQPTNEQVFRYFDILYFCILYFHDDGRLL